MTSKLLVSAATVAALSCLARAPAYAMQPDTPRERRIAPTEMFHPEDKPVAVLFDRDPVIYSPLALAQEFVRAHVQIETPRAVIASIVSGNVQPTMVAGASTAATLTGDCRVAAIARGPEGLYSGSQNCLHQSCHSIPIFSSHREGVSSGVTDFRDAP